ncbi:MAG: hemerythrin domain-containing protein [Dehalococcoidia bacterium]
MGISVSDRIGQLLAQHEHIKQGFDRLEKSVSDLDSVSQLKAAREKMESGKPAAGSTSLDLEKVFASIEKELTIHFSKEEDALEESYKILQDEGLISALSALRADHIELLSRIKDLRAEAEGISSANLSLQDQKDRTFLAKVHITNYRMSLENHAEQETLMFKRLKDKLSAT